MIVLLFYFFISAAVLLFGAEVNAEIYHQVAEGEDEDGGDQRHALRILTSLGTWPNISICRSVPFDERDISIPFCGYLNPLRYVNHHVREDALL